MDEQEALETLTGLGFGEADARTLADHFLDAERRGKTRARASRGSSGWRPGRSSSIPRRGRSASSASPATSAGTVTARSAT